VPYRHSYINYKLQSVAHLPLSAFMYKLFSTFIDDVFAFMIKMPWKHRIMTFRDDLVFFGFLYVPPSLPSFFLFFSSSHV
jgi:hypothetical protein